jgi:hypothetical protein
LLQAAQASSRLTDDASKPLPTDRMKFDATVPVNNWFFGSTPTDGQKAVGLQIGGTTIGFTVLESEMRRLGRAMTSASWKVSSSASLWSLLRSLVRDFASDLWEWSRIIVARVTFSSKRISNSFVARITGRSLRIFRTIIIAPGVPVPKYDPANECIYCQSLVYSTLPNIRRHPLGGEHVIAEGLGGTIELPLASCLECERETGSIVENDVVGRTLRALRAHLKLKKKGSGPPPRFLPIQATVYGKEKTIELPIEDYPILFMMFAFYPPLIEDTGDMPSISGVRVVSLKHDEKDLFRKYQIGSFATPYWDHLMFRRMLAKIGHALAAAELGIKSFSPLLTDLIRHGDRAGMRFVGGEPDLNANPASSVLHELGLGYQKIAGATYVVAKIRLFAQHGGPIYYVITGKSLETPMARFKRVLSNRISRIPAR